MKSEGHKLFLANHVASWLNALPQLLSFLNNFQSEFIYLILMQMIAPAGKMILIKA